MFDMQVRRYGTEHNYEKPLPAELVFLRSCPDTLEDNVAHRPLVETMLLERTMTHSWFVTKSAIWRDADRNERADTSSSREGNLCTVYYV